MVVETLSVIIPAFNEAAKIKRDICSASAFLSSQRLCGEIIVVDDGSSDQTAEIARASHLPTPVSLIVIRNEQHRGKGAAVRAGMKASTGDNVAFADSGVTVPFEDFLAGLSMIRNGECEIAHGSRRLSGSVIVKEQDWDRRLASRLFHRVVIGIVHVSPLLTDTQCGFKIYNGEVARVLFNECVTEGFMFDIELILRAQQRGYRIREFPVHWTCDRDSRLSFLRSPWSMVQELAHIKRALGHLEERRQTSHTGIHPRNDQSRKS